MEYLAYSIIAVAALGLASNFFFIFFMDANDKLNAAYLEEKNNRE